jgi:hypothetical protein
LLRQPAAPLLLSVLMLPLRLLLMLPLARSEAFCCSACASGDGSSSQVWVIGLNQPRSAHALPGLRCSIVSCPVVVP